VDQQQKVLKYRINAVLSSKTYTPIFDKIPPSGTRRAAIWILKNYDPNAPPFEPPKLDASTEPTVKSEYEENQSDVHTDANEHQATEGANSVGLPESAEEPKKRSITEEANGQRPKRLKSSDFERDEMLDLLLVGSDDDDDIDLDVKSRKKSKPKKKKSSSGPSSNLANDLQAVLQKLGRPASSDEVLQAVIEGNPSYLEDVKVLFMNIRS
jgi:hypothetical protein